MRIYTKTGDSGKTSLFDGKEVEKNSLRVESYGTLDELVSVLGIAKNYVIDDEEMYNLIHNIQKKLFTVSAELATKDLKQIQVHTSENDIDFIERKIDDLMSKTSIPDHFIIPGSSKASAYLHLGRTVCRRAERLIYSLKKKEKINPLILIYINRLSDCLYAMARVEEDRLDEVNF